MQTMAQTCIVCLSELESSDSEAAFDTQHHDDLDSGHTALASKGKASVQHPPTPEHDDELLAHLLPCGHHLHNECLKPWVERANSCPICRASFNKVQLCAKIGGVIISSYDVADKRQEPILDPGLLVQDDIDPEDTHQDPCMTCAEYHNGRESELLCCNSCNNTCHPFCAGFEEIPRGPWYCFDCLENPAAVTRAAQNRSSTRNNRRWRRRQSNPEQEWARVWQSVRYSTGIDLDFPFESQEEEQIVAARRARDDLEQRARVAAEQGAGDRFRRAAESLLEGRAQRHRTPPKPAPESQEEILAWNAFEKAHMARNPETATGSRRKRKSPSASPEEPSAAEPERVLKRPRTRKTQNTGESSNATPAATAEEPIPVQAGPSQARPELPTTSASNTNGNQPSFLQSLLKEVEVNASADDGQANQGDLVPFFDRASSPQSPQLSSPGASPPLSPQATPRAGTPPPLMLSRLESPPLASNIIPIYPAAPEFPPFSPADPDAPNPTDRKNRHNRPPRHSPETSPHRSNDASPTRSNISYSTKSEIQRMVTAVLKPKYRNQEVTKDQYTDINRDVSRSLYDKVGDAGGLADASTREKWQKTAEEEVDSAIKALKVEVVNAAPTTPVAGS